MSRPDLASKKGFVNSRNFSKPSRTLSKPMQTDNFVNGTSAVYVDQMYDMWREDPQSVNASWRAYFSNVENDSAEPFQAPPTLGRDQTAAAQVP